MKDMFDLFGAEAQAKPPKTRAQWIELFRRYDHAYYIVGEPEITDQVYDAEKREFLRWFPEEKGKTIGAAVPENTPWTKANHEIPMGSLDNALTESEFRVFAKDAALDDQYCISDKLDGLSLNVTFWSGAFRQAILRGDGTAGEDITRNVRLMKGVPPKLPVNTNANIRGEIVLLKADFEKLVAEQIERGEKPYANARNAAAGISRRLDGLYSDRLTVIFYNILSEHMFHGEHQKFDYLKNVLGLQTPFYAKVTLEEAVRIHNEYSEGRRAALPYDIDGMVVTVNDLNRQEFLGGGLLPKFAIAFKFDAEVGQTPLQNVIWQAGRTGFVTPVAQIQPVKLAGVTVSNVTLHNVAEIDRLNLRIGQIVEVKRSGDVIPKIVRTLGGDGQPIVIPTECPVCDSKLVNNAVQLRCVNTNCTAKTTKGLILWLDKLEVMQFGEKLVEQLEERGLVREPADFYKLQPEHISNIEGRGQVIAQKVLDELNDKREVTLDTLLAALSIPNLSDKTAKLLVSHYGTLDKILEADLESLCSIQGVADKTAEAIKEGLDSKREIIQNVLPYLTVTQKEKVSDKLAGKTFCFTNFRDADLEVEIEANGGKILSGVSKKLNYLVVDNESPSSKRAKATQLGVPVVHRSVVEKMMRE